MSVEPAAAAEPTVTTVGEGRASGAPDSLRLHVSVRFGSASVSDALAGCASRLDAAAGVARGFTDADQISSSGLRLDRSHDGDGSPTGYVAEHSLLVVCHDLQRAGELVTAMAERVGEELRIGHIEMFLSDTAAMRVQARELAFADARAKAEELAALADQRVRHARSVVEGGGGHHPLEHAMAAAGTAFEPGTWTIEATLTVTWATTYL